MATVNRENIGTLHDKITVKLSKEDYLPAFDKSLKQYAKQANVPGFRKGMVPAGMVKKMYGPSIFNDEVFRTAGRQLEDYLTEQKLAIFAQPLAVPGEEPIRLDMNTPGDVDFSFEIGLKPDFEIPAIQNKASLTRYKVAVSDKMLEDELLRIQRRYGKANEELASITAKEDIVYANIEAADEQGNVAEGAQKLEEAAMIEKLPAGLQDMLMNKAVGDVITFRPADVATEEELQGFLTHTLKAGPDAANQHYRLTITKLAQLEPHALDQELFAQVFPNDLIADEQAFRDRIRQELGREFDRVTSDRLNNEIYELLVHQTPIELPVAFLKRWMKEGGEKPKSEAEVEQEFPGFDHQLRWTLISDKLIKDNNIQVSHEDVTNHIKENVLRYFGMDADEQAPWLDSYMQKIAKDEKTLNETYQRLMFERLFDFLQTQFTIVEEEIGEEEFFKLPDAHAAHHHHH